VTSETQPPATHQRPVVLVVDEDAAFRESVRFCLEDRFDIIEASDGPTALKVVASDPVDLVLLDVLLPGMDGFELMARLQTARPDVQTIIVAALDRAATATHAAKLGAFDYVVKPFDGDELISLISLAIRTPRLRRSARDTAVAAPCTQPDVILLVGRDVALLSALKILLRADADAAVASTMAGVLRQLHTSVPTLAIVDDAIGWPEVVTIVKTLRDNFDCTVIIAYTPARDFVLHHFAPLRPDALVAKPYDVNDIMQTIRSALAFKRRRLLSSTRLSSHVTKALSYICGHFNAATLDAAADAGGVSAGYLAHLFPAELGMTFWDYVTAVRLEIVKDLLTETTHKLDYVAEIAGFCDAPHLSRVFRQHYGQPPGRYRHSTRVSQSTTAG
jgi:CheY-like chemotaxis protein